ncbi:mannosyl-3-phosphoglycerate phosphatase-related protein, partial [Enterobacter hormaechei]
MNIKFTRLFFVDENVVAEGRGLTRPGWVLARNHEASVTLIWRDSDEQMRYFAAELARQRLKIVQGAR